MNNINHAQPNTDKANDHLHQVLYDDPMADTQMGPLKVLNQGHAPAYLNGGLQRRAEFLSAARNRRQPLHGTSMTAHHQARPKSMAAIVPSAA